MDKIKKVNEQEFKTLCNLYFDVYNIITDIHGIMPVALHFDEIDGKVEVYGINRSSNEVCRKCTLTIDDIVGDFDNIRQRAKEKELKNDPDYYKYLELKKKFEQ